MVREEGKDTAASRRAVAVPSLRKAVMILDLIGRRGRLAFSTIQKTLDLPKSTTHQLLKALVDISAVQLQADGRFVLGPKICELGCLGIRQRTIDSLSLKHLELLAGQSGFRCEIATFEGRDAVVLASARPGGDARCSGYEGMRWPLNRAATGKALLAFLDEADRMRLLADLDWTKATPRSIASPDAMRRELELIRQRGWALDDREVLDDTSCIAAPVFDGRNRVVAAIATVGQADMITPERYEMLAGLVRNAANAVSQDVREA
ncbi:IclR family transcriptional regulator [Pleomorphomonas sp. NRK KF1]|uniref:IclR family transcriptional regulator n=1 Tax=Pleomorphomonas sp. NRK KF1 TaxID=2943000 RepID=UPI002043AB9D|nr:IclR family transcriptional regulator [Pleomorphomonas sp. NRK KF1]MCM5551941.1 IclR family transcriptional regulator [Pleomorphomonas sp. NRK KF1]